MKPSYEWTPPYFEQFVNVHSVLAYKCTSFDRHPQPWTLNALYLNTPLKNSLCVDWTMTRKIKYAEKTLGQKVDALQDLSNGMAMSKLASIL